ncbi:MAG: hypothetical protein EBS55_13250 [Flavobacteriaceae bacterium]|nr:hypothetical protein [Flavobacteriaceae bacterium]
MNSQLYNKTIELPKEVKEYLQTCFDHIPNSDSNMEGHNRNEELRNSGYVTYQQLGRIKNWFDNYDGDGTDAPYILNGADYMRNWVESTIQDLRKQTTTHQSVKEIKPEEIDVNFIKDLGPIADMLRPSKEHSTFTQDVRIKEDLKRINQIMKQII